MPNILLRRSTALILSLLPCFFHTLNAQKAGLEVTRTSAISRELPVTNVAVDASGRKWAANRNGVFQIKAADFASTRTLAAGEKCVLSYRGGNADFSWSDEVFKNLVKAECIITAAWYDEKNATLWIGTEESGLFQFKTAPQLQLEERYTSANSKLKSDNVTIIFQDKTGRMWIGTDRGLTYGTPGRWKADFTGYEVQRIREYGNVIYVLADGEISLAPNGDKWSDLGLDTKKLEGQIADFDIDKNGKMWIVSGMLTRFDLLASAYETFSGPEYYTSQYGSCIAIDGDDAVWLGTEDKGLYLVDKASAITLNAYVEQPISCSGDGKDAVLRAKITGGTPPYNYVWTGGLAGENPKNVAPGTYTVTVTDTKGKSRVADVPVPDSRLRIKARQRKPVSAPGQTDAVAEVDIESNASGLSIRWDNGETMAVASKLPAGTHSVTVTDPKGCSSVATVTIADKILPLEAAVSEKSGIRCAGEKSAVLVAQVTGGKGPYQYKWSNPAFNGEQPENVPAGDYQLTVTDAAGKTSVANISVKQPEVLSMTVQVQSPAGIGTADGKALAQAKGGTGVYLFKWDNGESAFSASKLAAGQRSVTVTDANGCTATATVSITENILPLAVKITEKSTIKCAGGNSGALDVEVSGGKGPFRYSWSDPILSGGQPAGLKAGNYQVTVTDATGTSSTAVISMPQPQPVAASAQAQSPASIGNSDGKASVQASGGAGSFQFKWDNGEATASAAKLAAGQHSVTVTDANGCTATAAVSITENILPLAVSIVEKSAIKCSGAGSGALEVQITGGKGPFRYAWNAPTLSGGQPSSLKAGSYQVTVTDATGTSSTATINVTEPQPLAVSAQVQSSASTGNSDGKASVQASGGAGNFQFKWDNGEGTATASKLPPGVHSVTATDANGCTATASVEITENILPLSVRITEKDKIKCAGEKTASLSVQVTGGKAPFRYSWDNGALRDDQPSGLSAGTYQLTLTDAVGTSSTASISIVQPELLSVTTETVAPASTGKADGKATAQAAGGAGTYQYKWDNGENLAAAVKLAPGQRTVTVTDANGCTATAGIDISENILPLVVSVSAQSPIKCAGQKATLSVKVSGGKGPFTYTWNNPSVQGNQPAGLDAGVYSVTVTDATGTTQTAEIDVVAPQPLVVELTRNMGATTDRSNDGKAQVAVTGGTGNYNIEWDTKQTGTSVSKLPMGKHSVIVTDANGCVQNIDFETEKRILPELTGALESGQVIRMRLLNFDSDSYSLQADALPMLDELYDFMMENGGAAIEIGGHTNNVPSDAFADELSAARAKAVADYLFAKGIDPKRVVYKGYGKRLPLVPNTSAEGRKTNQRVEIKILKIRD